MRFRTLFCVVSAALLAFFVAAPSLAQLTLYPRGWVSAPTNIFSRQYNAGLGGSLGIGVRNGQWNYALNFGYGDHQAKFLPPNWTGYFEYGLVTLSADYEFTDTKVRPFGGLELGGAFGKGALEAGGQPVIASQRTFNQSMIMIAPTFGARWHATERFSLEAFAKLAIFTYAQNTVASSDNAFATIPIGLGMNFVLGDDEGSSRKATAAASDRDNDGVPDAKDRCPDEAGLSMNKGCPEVPMNEVKALDDKLNQLAKKILFPTSSAVIEPGSYGDLDELVKIMKKYPNTRFAVEGHTDNTGNADANKKLSQERADAVKAYFTGKGIEATRLDAMGYGQERPVGDNSTDAGRAQNRRVEIHPVIKK